MKYAKKTLFAHVGRMEQVAAIRRYTLEDGKGRGMRAFEVSNGTGFSFVVYPDRGLDIGPAFWCGKSLTWMTRNGPVNPAFYDSSAFEWLRTWQGGLVTTCGWNNVGGPNDTQTGAEGLHGRADHTPAEEVNTCCAWRAQENSALGADAPDEVYEMTISGKIRHARVFGENLETTRTIRTHLGLRGLELIDRTENLGATPMPLMQLYHMNFGWPLISESMRLEAPEHAVSARDAAGERGLADWQQMPPPTCDFAEQVLFHDLPADDEGFAAIQVANPSFFPHGEKLTLSFRKKELPFLVQWRQAGVGDYVMGLEPGNCYPIGQTEFSKTGLLRTIAPGEVVETHIRVSIA